MVALVVGSGVGVRSVELPRYAQRVVAPPPPGRRLRRRGKLGAGGGPPRLRGVPRQRGHQTSTLID